MDGLQHKKNKSIKLLAKEKNIDIDDFWIKMKSKRDPIPMKMRALPPSFWQQPNEPGPVLPPLVPAGKEDDTTNPAEAETAEKMVVSDANTDLLFSLFRGVEPGPKFTRNKRGRPKKLSSCQTSGVVRDEDPYLVSEGALPVIGGDFAKNRNSANYSQLLNDLVIRL